MSCKYETEWCKNHVHCSTCGHYEMGDATTMDATTMPAAFDSLTAEEQRELFAKVGQASAYTTPDIEMIYKIIQEIKGR